MALQWPNKDPADILDYQINWALPLNGDIITTSTWAISDPSLIQTAAAFTASTTTIWLSAGTLGVTYSVKNKIVTAGGRTFDQTVNITISTH
jgi:hypothetical protein